MELIDYISNELNVQPEMLNDAIEKGHLYIKRIKLPKKDGTIRYVYQPSKASKVIQYWLINNIFCWFPIHECALAYKKNTSIKQNAERHKYGKYFLKIDFKDFFPSIKYKDIENLLISSNAKGYLKYNNHDLLYIINKVCFFKDESLPIGFPSSPVISNILMYSFDKQVFDEMQNDKYGNVTFTRYADDCIFSTNKKNACSSIKDYIYRFVKELDSPDLKINRKKTLFLSSSGGSIIATGLKVCHDNHLTIPRKYKDKVRLLLSLYNKHQLNNSDISSLKGHLSYIKHVDSAFYTKLKRKYFNSICDLYYSNS